MPPISNIKTLNYNGVTYFLPESNEELIELITFAKENQKSCVVRGSGHSYPMMPNLAAQTQCIFVLLSNFRQVTFDDQKMQVTVGAGCNLGRDPFDPTGVSTLDNSLFHQVFKKGWAIPEMGGIIHQTVGGFLSTGSSGGSVKFSFDEMLVNITFITAEDPTPQIRTFSKGDAPNDDFCAAGIAMGMYGIIISATFQCLPTFNIEGKEVVSMVKDCAIDLFGASDQNLETFFKTTDYTRLIWWPQSHVQKMIVWQAAQIPATADFKPKPYEEVPSIFGSEVPASVAADLVYTAIGNWPSWFENAFENKPWTKIAADAISAAFYPTILPLILEKFEPVDDPQKGPQKFHDYWWSGLCMDNQMNDKLMPVHFTELWIPLNQAQNVMNELKAFYAENDAHAGTFCLEIYAAKSSDFWMSPSFGTDVIRLDVYWFANTDKDPITTLFQGYWDRFDKFNFRCHWGKYLPTTVNGASGATYLKSQYPKWDQWFAKRSVYDPKNIFVNPYWKNQLNIQ